jgi:hypothetical protein
MTLVWDRLLFQDYKHTFELIMVNGIFFCLIKVMKKYHAVGIAPSYNNSKIVKRWSKPTSLTHIYMTVYFTGLVQALT